MNARSTTIPSIVSLGFALNLVFASLPSSGAITFYGGDSTGDSTKVDSHYSSGQLTMVFDDFYLAQPTWVTRLWGNYSEAEPSGGTSRVGGGFKKLDFPGSPSAYFEIRSGGVSPGYEGPPGDLFVSGYNGTAGVAVTPTGRTVGTRNESEVSLVTSFLLPAGHYWMGIAVDSETTLLLSTTPGVNGEGVGATSISENSFVWQAAGPGQPGGWMTPAAWAAANGYAAFEGSYDFSYGFEGVAVPEASTFVAGALLVLPAGVQGWRVWRRRTAG